MGENLLRCTVNEHFEVKLAYKYKKNDILIGACLLEDGVELRKSKDFLWPEKKLPINVKFDAERNLLLISGNTSRIELPIRISDKLAISLGMGKQSKRRKFFKTFAENAEPLETNALDDLNRIARKLEKDEVDEDQINKLIASLQNLSAEMSVFKTFSSINLSESNQSKLLSLLISTNQEKGQENNPEILFSALQLKIVNSFRSINGILDNFAENNRFDLIIKYLESTNLVDEAVIANCLKISALKQLAKKEHLLAAISMKIFTKEGLLKCIRKTLNEEDITILFKIFASMCLNEKYSNVFNKIVDLMNIMLDSHFQRLIWDEKSGKSIHETSETLSDLVMVVDAFHKLSEHSKNAASESKNKYLGDYFVRHVNFREIPL